MTRWSAAVVVTMLMAALAPATQAAPGEPIELGAVGFKLESPIGGDIAGYALAVGDFDGDGVADLAVGAGCDPTNGLGSGAVYILYGPITPDRSLAEPDALLLGPEPGAYFGEFMGVLDMDGDGAAELVVGVPGPVIGAGPVVDRCFMDFFQPGLNRAGGAYVFHGGERLSGVVDADAVAGTVITGLAPADYAGYHVGGVDLDGDGADELVIGAVGAVGLAGAAFVFPGGDMPPSAAAIEAEGHVLGERPLDMFGRNIVGGDVNGDGIADLLITAPSLDDGREGTTYVFLGGALPSGVIPAAEADILLVGSPGEWAGESLAVGDLDGDGVDDIVVGAPGSDTAYVFYGPLDRRGVVPLADADARVRGRSGTSVGISVAVANLGGGDRSDLLIGASRDNTGGGDRAGAVYRLSGAISGDVDATTTGDLMVGQVGEQAGLALSVADVTGDGIDDLVVGAPAFSLAAQGEDKPGAVYIVPGGSGPT